MEVRPKVRTDRFSDPASGIRSVAGSSRGSERLPVPEPHRGTLVFRAESGGRQQGIFPVIPRNIPPPSCGVGLPCERGCECAEEGGAKLDAPFALGLGDGALAHAETIGRSLLGQAESGPPTRQIGSGERDERVGTDWLRSRLLNSRWLLPRLGKPFLRARRVWPARWSTLCRVPGSDCGRRGAIRSPRGGV